MGVTISSPKGLEAWLYGKLRDRAQAIAVRAALRVLPLTCDPAAFRDQLGDPRVPLAVFRVNAMLSGLRKIPPDDIAYSVVRSARAAAYASATDADAADASPAARAAAAAVDAAYFADDAADAAAAAADAAAYSADAAAASADRAAVRSAARAAARAAAAAFWAAVSDDCTQLHGRTAPAALLDQPLWSERPDWFQEA